MADATTEAVIAALTIATANLLEGRKRDADTGNMIEAVNMAIAHLRRLDAAVTAP